MPDQGSIVPQELPETSLPVNHPAADPTWDCLFGLPNRRYLDFVGRYLLQVGEGNDKDPFATDLPDDLVKRTHVERQYVESEVLRPGTRITLGAPGTGKSAVYRALVRHLILEEPWVLLVGQTPPDLTLGTSVPNASAGEGSALTAPLLIHKVFDSYWDAFMRNDSKRPLHLPQLRLDRGWMELLRWFYQHYPPNRPEVNDFELMAWLSGPCVASPIQANPSGRASLEALIELVCWEAQRDFYGITGSRQAYRRVDLLLDEGGQLSPRAISRLLSDFQALYGLGLGTLHVKLFLDTAWQRQVEALPCVREGRVGVFRLPSWTDSEIGNLLRGRVFALLRGAPYYPGLQECSLDYLLAAAGRIRAHAGDQLESCIIKQARGVPLHALRIARGVVAAASGCWLDDDRFKLPLSSASVDRVAEIYYGRLGVGTVGADSPSNRQRPDEQ